MTDRNQETMDEFFETVRYDVTPNWQDQPELGLDPDDEEDDVHKASNFRRLDAIPFETPKNLEAVDRYKAALQAALSRVRSVVVRQVRAKLGKIAKGPAEDAEARAQQIIDSLDLSELNVLVEQLGQIGVDVATGAAVLAVAQFGMQDYGSLIDQINTRAGEWAEDRAAELVGMRYDAKGNLVAAANAEMRIDDTTRDMLRDTISQGILNGDRIDEIATDIEDGYAFSEERAATIAGAEVRRAQSQGALTGYKEASRLGVHTKKEWLVADEPCEICEPNGEQGPIELDEAFDSGDDAPPAHPHCLPGYAMVSPVGRIAAVSKRWYEGDLVIIRTAAGKQLAATVNHPILTPVGLAPAGSLDVGDYVVCGGLGERVASRINLDHENVPTRIEEIANTFRCPDWVSATSIPTAGEDFHGDGAGSKVAVIWTDSLLRDDGDALISEHTHKSHLVVARMLDQTFVGHSPLELFLERNSPAANGVMRSGSVARTLFGGEFGGCQESSFAVSPHLDTYAAQPLDERHAMDAEPLGQFLGRFACAVSVDVVTEVRREFFAGHVYNLQTESGAIISDGIVTSNCRCAIAPVVDNDTIPDDEDADEE